MASRKRNSCECDDHMLWIAKKVGVDLKVLTKTKAKCALTVRHLMKDPRSVNACEVALRFSDGLATKGELASAAAVDYAYADYAIHAAYAAAADDAAYAARRENRKAAADICREILTDEVFKKLSLI